MRKAIKYTKLLICVYNCLYLVFRTLRTKIEQTILDVYEYYCIKIFYFFTLRLHVNAHIWHACILRHTIIM